MPRANQVIKATSHDSNMATENSLLLCTPLGAQQVQKANSVAQSCSIDSLLIGSRPQNNLYMVCIVNIQLVRRIRHHHHHKAQGLISAVLPEDGLHTTKIAQALSRPYPF